MATINPSERSAKLQKALEKTLTSSKANKLVNSVINDLSSSKNLSFRTLLLGAKFALTNPVNTYNLVKFAKSSETYLDPEFQKSLLERTPIWEFLKKNADNLPKIGQILANAGFREFQEGNFLDQKGLNILKESFKNEQVLGKLQEVAVEARKEFPDWNKVISSSFDMLAQDNNFKKFFNEKSEDITNYIKSGVSEILPADYIKAFDDILQKPENRHIQKIFNKNPALKQELAENIKNPNKGDNFNKLKDEEKLALKPFLEEARAEAKPFLKEYIKDYYENYDLNTNDVTKLLNVMPLLLDKPESLQKVWNGFTKGDYTGIAKELIILTKEKPEIKQYLNDNVEIFSKVLDKALVSVPGANALDKKGLLKELPSMLNHPDELVTIIKSVENKDYTTAATTALYNLGIVGVTKGVKYAAQAGVNYAAQTVTNMFGGTPQQQAAEDKITDSNILIDQAVDKVFMQAQTNGVQDLPSKKEFTKQIKILCRENSVLEDYIVKNLSASSINNVSDVSTPEVNFQGHVKDYINTPKRILNPLYENLVNKQDLKSELFANMLSEKVSEKLFQKGDNRAEDFYMINQKLKQAISEYVKENPNCTDHFFKPENQEILANNIAGTLNSKSKYTWAGLVTGGIYLPKDIFNDELKNNFKNEFKVNWQENILAEARNISSQFKNKITLTDNSKLSPPPNTLSVPKEKGKSNGIT